MYDRSYYHYYRFLRIRRRDEVLTDKLMDFANLSGVALMFSQLSEGISALDFFLGAFLFIVAYAFVWYYLSRFH